MSLNSYVTMGRSGLRVSPFTLGTMTFGEDWQLGSSPEEAKDVLAAYIDRGGNSLDTANLYTNGHAEKIVGDYLESRPGLRDRLVIGTKFFGNLHLGDPNGGGAGRKGITHQLEDSLRRLRTDYVDIYWLHNYNPRNPIDETMRTLDDLVSAGKIRYVGMSDLPAWRFTEASVLANFRGWAPVTAVQLEYSLLERTAEGEVIPAAEAFGAGIMPWSPLRSGRLSGTYGSDRPVPDTIKTTMMGMPTDTEFRVIDAVNEIADEAGVSSAQIALAWVRGRRAVTSTIIGARTLRQLEANLASLDVQLSEDHRKRLDEVSEPQLSFPASVNRLAAAMEFGGSTVDGRAHDVFPPLAGNPTRY
ncbi:aldo/keto reductase [Actinoplanes sp. TRM 88003]|uniref:Aldo/keto reductase n=1 Tax=Paractinoplanes aksuensis TaxID=2939490 RepID=A0ABT1E4H7_9ACTN|nr:aldo/keto reductase [Actinoplanes aksuensis]MCO8278045.1 aldo/keto reductase [Actinoplanes aksuensis]